MSRKIYVQFADNGRPGDITTFNAPPWNASIDGSWLVLSRFSESPEVPAVVERRWIPARVIHHVVWMFDA